MGGQMLYKVTPMMPDEAPPKAKVERAPGQPRKKRKASIYDAEGNEVLITLMCLKCKKMKPLMQFGLRKMADGAIRNQPWCRTCRSGAGTSKPREAAVVAAEVARVELPLAEAPAPTDAPAAASASPDAPQAAVP
jgi:hypothetical protein